MGSTTGFLIGYGVDSLAAGVFEGSAYKKNLAEVYAYAIQDTVEEIFSEDPVFARCCLDGSVQAIPAGLKARIPIKISANISKRMRRANTSKPMQPIKAGPALGTPTLDIDRRAGSLGGSPLCFAAGTLVHTYAGTTPIEQVRQGDVVLGANETSREVVTSKVVALKTGIAEAFLRLGLNDESILVTRTHPIYVSGRGFVEAQYVRIGDVVWSYLRGESEIMSVEHVIGERRVFNLSVADIHTYFVGSCGVLVHNK